MPCSLRIRWMVDRPRSEPRFLSAPRSRVYPQGWILPSHRQKLLHRLAANRARARALRARQPKPAQRTQFAQNTARSSLGQYADVMR
jgi:hypothetical protein